MMHALRRLAPYGLALAAGLAAAWAVREHVGQRMRALEASASEAMVERLVAAEDLAAGTRLGEAQLQTRWIPAAWAPVASLDSLSADRLMGAVLSADIGAGEPFLPAHVIAARALESRPVSPLSSESMPALPAGMRALTVTAAELGPLAARLRAGDRIDIYVSFSHAGKRMAAPVLQAARVLSAGAPEGGGDSPVAGAVLATSPEEALRFVAARQGGVLTAMLRHREDAVATQPAGRADLASLLGLSAESGPAAGVVILYGDRLARPAEASERRLGQEERDRVAQH